MVILRHNVKRFFKRFLIAAGGLVPIDSLHGRPYTTLLFSISFTNLAMERKLTPSIHRTLGLISAFGGSKIIYFVCVCVCV